MREIRGAFPKVNRVFRTTIILLPDQRPRWRGWLDWSHERTQPKLLRVIWGRESFSVWPRHPFLLFSRGRRFFRSPPWTKKLTSKSSPKRGPAIFHFFWQEHPSSERTIYGSVISHPGRRNSIALLRNSSPPIGGLKKIQQKNDGVEPSAKSQAIR